MRDGGTTPRQMAELTNAIQRFFIERVALRHSRDLPRGMPARSRGPDGDELLRSRLASAATFNPELVESLFAMTAAEARARGTHQALTPVVDVARDPRWGRVEETFGEDPYLVSRMGIAAVRGFQGDAHLPRQDARDRDAQALRGARAAGVGHELRAGERFDARAARDVPLPVPRGDPRRPARSASWRRTTRSTASRRTPTGGCCATCCATSGDSRGFVVSDYYAIRELTDAARDARPPRGARQAQRPARSPSAPA